MIIYQIYPRSFMDSNADGIGDLPGIIERLPYIASLGVDYVWISPFFKSPQKDFGYDVSDYQTVDPSFGSNKDFDRLITEAKKLGLKIMVDLVLAHSSNQHAWFLESRENRINPKADWYVWADAKADGTPPNNWMSVFGGPAWRWEPRRGQYYLTHFLPEQPAFNMHNPQMEQALLDLVKYWLDKGVDGYRLDAIHFAHYDRSLKNNPAADPSSSKDAIGPFAMQQHLYDMGQPETLDFIRKMRQIANAAPTEAFLLGEVGELDVAASYVGPDKFHSSYCFEFLYVREPMSAAGFKSRIENVLSAYTEGLPCWAFSNHDTRRHASRMGPADAAQQEAFAKLMAAAIAILPGHACVYQGEELGLPEADVAFEDIVDPFDRDFYPNHVGRDTARTPMPWTKEGQHAGFSTSKGKTWLPVDTAKHAPLAVDQQEGKPDSTLNVYRELLKLRRDNPWLTEGKLAMELVGDTVLKMINAGSGGTWTLWLNFSPVAYQSDALQLAPYSYKLLRA